MEEIQNNQFFKNVEINGLNPAQKRVFCFSFPPVWVKPQNVTTHYSLDLFKGQKNKLQF